MKTKTEPSKNQSPDFELPEVSDSYLGWSISVEGDEEHKYVISAVKYNYVEEIDEREIIASLEMNGDEIGEHDDADAAITRKIDEYEKDEAAKNYWNKNYEKEMGLDSNWYDSNDPN